uniref:PKD/REJ-like domain-containing protein n=1 Tax=Micromonas pusilla TaxID=38833 RepID=A0A7S0PRM3_MICPS
MADSLGSIDVRFDAATDRALSGGEGSCAGLLSDETVGILGTGARCAWSNDFVLTLYTGKDPIAMPRTALSVADKIELRPGVVRAKLGASRAAFGAAEIEPPLNPLTVDAHLVGPTTIGACDPALFTASSSTGAGGRPMRYRFGVTSEHDAGKILERIRSLPANMSSSELELRWDDLEPGGVYAVTVEVTNFLGAASTATVTAIKSTAPAPIVAIEGPEIVRTTPGASLEFTALARLPSGSCLRQSAASKIGTRIAYAWTLVEGPSLDFGAGTLARTSETPRLYVEPRTLEFDSTYVFRVEAKLAAAEFHRASDTVTVKVGYDSIDDPVVLGPSSSPSGAALELFALNRDPMLADSASRYPWSHRWECWVFRGHDDTRGEACPVAIESHLFVDADRLVVPDGVLTAEKTDARFEFAYTAAREPTVPAGDASRASRRKTTTKTVHVSATPTLSTRARFTSRVPGVITPSEQTVFYCDVIGASGKKSDPSDASDVSFRWSVVGKPSGFIDAALDRSVGGADSRVIVVAPGALNPGEEYAFRCDARDAATGARGFAECVARVNAPPTGGIAVLTSDSPPSPVELIDTLAVLATGWTDPDGGVRYQLTYGPAPSEVSGGIPDDDDAVLVTGGASGRALIRFTLPAGTHELYLRVSDAIGASTIVPVTLTDGVTPAEVTAREMPEASASADGRRRMLQASSGAAAMAARAWDPAAGTGDLDAAYAFIHAFSRAYGGDPKASCPLGGTAEGTDDAATTATKTRVLVELKALDAGSVPNIAGATRQLACALGAGILHAVGEVSDAAISAVDDALVAGKLRWMLAESDSGGATTGTTHAGSNVLSTQGLGFAAARCAHSVATRMLAVARCNGATGPDEAKLRSAHDAFVLIGTLLARGRIPGQSQLKLGPTKPGDPAVYVHSQRAASAGVVNGTTPKFDHPAGLVGKTYAQIDSSRDVGGGVLYDATGFVGGAFRFAVNVTRGSSGSSVKTTDTDGWFADPDGALVDVVAFMYDDGWAPFDIDASMESELNARGVKGAFGGSVFGVTGSWVDTEAGRRETARTSAIFGVDQARTLAAKRNLTDPNTHLGARWYDDSRREWTVGEDVAGTGVFVYTSEPALLLFARDAGAGLGFSFYAERSVAPPPSPPSPP